MSIEQRLEQLEKRIDGLERRLEFAERSISATTYRADSHDARIVKLENPIGKAPLNTHTTFDDAMKAGPTTLNHVVTPGPSPMVDHVGLVKPAPGFYADCKGNVVFDSREPEVVTTKGCVSEQVGETVITGVKSDTSEWWFDTWVGGGGFHVVRSFFGSGTTPITRGQKLYKLIRDFRETQVDLHAARDRIKALESELAKRPVVRWVPTHDQLVTLADATLHPSCPPSLLLKFVADVRAWVESCQRDLTEPPAQPAVQPATEQADTFPPRDFNADDEQCPRCSECPGSSHHWLDCFDDDEDDINSPHSHACKHCSAVGNECDECDGEGCEACDGEGVVRDLSVPAKVYRRPALNQPATDQAGEHGEAVTCPKGFRLNGRYPLLCEDYYGLDDNTYTVELSKAGRRATVTDGDETIHLLCIAGFSERQIQDAARYQIANIADMAGLVATVKAKPQTP